MSDWVTWLCSRNWHDIVNQLCPNKLKKKKKDQKRIPIAG